MRGCLFTLLIGAVAIAVFVVVGLPAIAAGAITAGVTAAGLQSDDTVVTVSSDPTDLLGLHADRVRVRATDATFRGLEIASLDLTLHDLHLVDRTARSIDGHMDGVVVPDVGGRALTLGTIGIEGSGETVTATATIPGAEVEAMIADRIEDALGARPTDVRLAAPDRLTVAARDRRQGPLRRLGRRRPPRADHQRPRGGPDDHGAAERRRHPAPADRGDRDARTGTSSSPATSPSSLLG